MQHFTLGDSCGEVGIGYAKPLDSIIKDADGRDIRISHIWYCEKKADESEAVVYSGIVSSNSS